MTHDEVIEAVFEALRHAEEKHPGWPTDPIHAAGILCEETGELMQKCIDFTYHSYLQGKTGMKEEAAQCAAMGIRFLLGINDYQPTKSRQR